MGRAWVSSRLERELKGNPLGDEGETPWLFLLLLAHLWGFHGSCTSSLSCSGSATQSSNSDRPVLPYEKRSSPLLPSTWDQSELTPS